MNSLKLQRTSFIQSTYDNDASLLFEFLRLVSADSPVNYCGGSIKTWPITGAEFGPLGFLGFEWAVSAVSTKHAEWRATLDHQPPP